MKKEPLSVGKKAQERDDKEKICAFYMGDKGRKRQREAKKVAFLEEKCTERAKTGGFRGLGLGSKGKNVQKLGFQGLRLRVDGGGFGLGPRVTIRKFWQICFREVLTRATTCVVEP